MGKSNSVGSLSAAERGRAKKKENDEIKRQKELERHEQQVAKSWEQGADLRSKQRSEEAERRAQEQDERRRQKQLQEEEEAQEFARASKPRTKKNKKTEQERLLLELHQQELEKKRIAKERQKEEERKKKVEEDKLFTKKDEDGDYIEDAPPIDPIEPNLNRQLSVESLNSGLDSALQSMNIGVPSEESYKAARKAFEVRESARLKEENPRLKKSQILDKVFKLWSRSPENPKNQH